MASLNPSARTAHTAHPLKRVCAVCAVVHPDLGPEHSRTNVRFVQFVQSMTVPKKLRLFIGDVT